MPSESHTTGATPGVVRCVHCNGEMKKGKKVERNMMLQIFGVFLFFAAAWMMQFIPIGTIGGLVLMIVAMQLGYARRSGWKCSGCGYFFERA